jgi:hypothetical protein
LAPTEKQPTSEFYLGDKLSDDQSEDLRKMLFEDFPELLHPVDSPHVGRPWDHPIDTNGPIRRHNRLNHLLPTERKDFNRHLEDVVTYGLIRPSRSEFGSPIRFVRKACGSFRLCTDYGGMNEVTRKDAYPLPRVDDTLDDVEHASFYTHLDLVSRFGQVRVRE